MKEYKEYVITLDDKELTLSNRLSDVRDLIANRFMKEHDLDINRNDVQLEIQPKNLLDFYVVARVIS